MELILTTVNRILNLMEERHVTANKLLTACKLNTSAITEWKKGKAKPSYESLKKIAEYFDVSVEYLLGKPPFALKINRGQESSEDILGIELMEMVNMYQQVNQEKQLTMHAEVKDIYKNKNKPKGIKIPVLGVIPAGLPIEAIEDIIDYEEVTEEMAKTGELFALKIKGDSMTPRICHNDVVIVKKQNDCDSGDIAVVIINGENATVKQIKKDANGITLIPFNTNYQPTNYTNQEIKKIPITIIGKVIELRGKF